MMLSALLDAVLEAVDTDSKAEAAYDLFTWLRDCRAKPLRSFKPQFAMAMAGLLISGLFATTYFVR